MVVGKLARGMGTPVNFGRADVFVLSECPAADGPRDGLFAGGRVMGPILHLP